MFIEVHVRLFFFFSVTDICTNNITAGLFLLCSMSAIWSLPDDIYLLGCRPLPEMFSKMKNNNVKIVDIVVALVYLNSTVFRLNVYMF